MTEYTVTENVITEQTLYMLTLHKINCTIFMILKTPGKQKWKHLSNPQCYNCVSAGQTDSVRHATYFPNHGHGGFIVTGHKSNHKSMERVERS
jgi:hypothetical protein